VRSKAFCAQQSNQEGWSFLRQFARQRAHGAAFRSQDIGGGHADLTLAGKVQKFRLREIAKAFAESPRKASA
jgi:hypothetical protein